MVSYFSIGSGISTRSIRQPWRTKTPKLIGLLGLIVVTLLVIWRASGIKLSVWQTDQAGQILRPPMGGVIAATCLSSSSVNGGNPPAWAVSWICRALFAP